MPLTLTASLKKVLLSMIARMLNESRLSEVVRIFEGKCAKAGILVAPSARE
jgi:hypothetical protein